jgi:hypothetical protein
MTAIDQPVPLREFLSEATGLGVSEVLKEIPAAFPKHARLNELPEAGYSVRRLSDSRRKSLSNSSNSALRSGI